MMNGRFTPPAPKKKRYAYEKHVNTNTLPVIVVVFRMQTNMPHIPVFKIRYNHKK